MKRAKRLSKAVRTPPARGVWDRRLWGAYVEAREALLDEVFGLAEDMGWSDNRLALEAGLAYPTVAAIAYKETREPRMTTIWKLCRAVGLQMAATRLRLARKAP